jgi:hypothetical protein
LLYLGMVLTKSEHPAPCPDQGMEKKVILGMCRVDWLSTNSPISNFVRY